MIIEGPKERVIHAAQHAAEVRDHKKSLIRMLEENRAEESRVRRGKKRHN